MTEIAQEFHQKAIDYLDGAFGINEFFKWLASHVQVIADTPDNALKELEAQVWIRIDDIDEGIEAEDDFRRWLSAELRNAAEPTNLWDASQWIVAGPYPPLREQ